MWQQLGAMYSKMLELTAMMALNIAAERRRLVRRETGQTMVEYAVIVALLVIVLMAAVQIFGQGVTTVFQNIVRRIQGVG